MSACPSCGHGNQAGAKFCSECGAALVAAEPLAREERKVVTVLFAAAQALLDEAEVIVSPTSWAAQQAQILLARADVDRLAGAPEQAAASLRAALRIYQDRTPPRSRTRPRPLSLASPPTPAASRPERPGDKPPGMGDLRAATRLTRR